nr:hypothetical protein [Tanacetum cinerariifolium]
MSTPAHFDSKIISYTVRSQSSRVPTSLPDDPYVAVRQAHLVDTNTEFGPPILVVPSPVLSQDDLHLTIRQAYTPATINTESELEEAPSELEEFLLLVSKEPFTDKEFNALEPLDTRTTSSHSSASSDSTAPVSLDHPLTQTSPTHTPTQASFHCSITRMTVRAQPTISPGLSARGTFELLKDTKGESLELDFEKEGSKDKSFDSDDEEEEAAPEGQQQAIAPSTFEVGQSFRSVLDQQVADGTPRIPEHTTWIDPKDVSPSFPVVSSPIASPSTTLATTISVDEDQFLEVGAQLELYESILHDHT